MYSAYESRDDFDTMLLFGACSLFDVCHDPSGMVRFQSHVQLGRYTEWVMENHIIIDDYKLYLLYPIVLVVRSKDMRAIREGSLGLSGEFL